MTEHTDRELLEAAAKAAGFAKFGPCLGGRGFRVSHTANRNDDFAGWFDWNPLTDDGDALRLAVKLGLAVDCLVPAWHTSAKETMVLYGRRTKGQITARCGEPHGEDALAATRRAIVRAAAALSKGGAA